MSCSRSRVLHVAAVVVSLAGAVNFLPGSANAQGLAEALLAEPRDRLLSDVATSGDARRGALVFHAAHLACLKCHVAGTGQALLGPNLAKMPEGVEGAALRSHLVDSVLEPSKVVRPEYRGVTVVDHDGRGVTGVVVRDTAAELVLRDATSPGSEIAIDKSTIDERSDLAVSLMPAGLANLLTGRGQFLDLVAYLEAVASGGASAAAALEPDPALLARSAPAAYEQEIDHAGFVAEWGDSEAARGALERGAAIYGRVCANCHGTLEAPGSLPTAPRFASHTFKRGADPLSLYSTLTVGTGQMVPQGWMVPSQKYDVIHYLRETFLKGHNDKAHVAITPDYLAALPKGTSRGPAPSATDPWRLHDYGPFLAATIEVGRDHGGIVRKGFSVRLDPGGRGSAAGGHLRSTTSTRSASPESGPATASSIGRGSISTAAMAPIRIRLAPCNGFSRRGPAGPIRPPAPSTIRAGSAATAAPMDRSRGPGCGASIMPATRSSSTTGSAMHQSWKRCGSSRCRWRQPTAARCP